MMVLFFVQGSSKGSRFLTKLILYTFDLTFIQNLILYTL